MPPVATTGLETMPPSKRRDGLLYFAVVGVAAKGAVAGAECAVYAGVELILVIGVVGGAGVIIRGSGVGEVRQQ